MVTAIPLPAGKDDPDVIYAAQTIFGEARGESWDGKIGVAWTILNRKEARRSYFGRQIRTIVQKHKIVGGIPRYQFSCWNPRDVNYPKICRPLEYEDRDVWLECYVAARLVLQGEVRDSTGGAMWYFDDSLLDNPPSWSAGLEQSAKHGRLNFFRECKKG